jgi:hypothetical protein
MSCPLFFNRRAASGRRWFRDRPTQDPDVRGHGAHLSGVSFSMNDFMSRPTPRCSTATMESSERPAR